MGAPQVGWGGGVDEGTPQVGWEGDDKDSLGGVGGG